MMIASDARFDKLLGFAGILKCWIAEKWKIFIGRHAILGEYYFFASPTGDRGPFSCSKQRACRGSPSGAQKSELWTVMDADLRGRYSNLVTAYPFISGLNPV